MSRAKIEGKRIGIIGIGNIGSSILRGLLSEIEDAQFLIADVRRESLSAFAANPRVEICSSNEELAKKSEILILAVKPRDVSGVLGAIAPFMEDKLLISVAAGVSTGELERYLADSGSGRRVRVIRAMPNIGARVGESVSALCSGSNAVSEDEELAAEIMSAIGSVYHVDEKEMDVITGLSGSGIAFFAEVIDAMADAGVYEGLPRDSALTIAAKTALGAARLILAGESPATIKAMTASPGGTTIRGLHTMESRAVRAAMMDAVIEATRRSREMG